MAKKPQKIHSDKMYSCHPKNPCGTCFACNLAGRKQGWNTGSAGCLAMTSLMLVAPSAVVALIVKVARS